MSSKPRTALVLGSAACVWDDVEAALSLGEYDGAVGCNHIGIIWPGRLDAWVTLHQNRLATFIVQRRRRGLIDHELVAGPENITCGFPGQPGTGSSGLMGLKVALVDLRFDRAVLCGIPLDGDKGHIQRPGFWPHAEIYQRSWLTALPNFADRARSMSGWTEQTLGRPTPEWLEA